MRSVIVLMAAAILVGAVESTAGVIHPALQQQLDQAAPDEKISVIVHLADKAPIASLDADLRADKASRQERHRVIVSALRDAAARSQQPVKVALDAAKSIGGVSGYTPYWISNLLVVEAKPWAIAAIAARPDVETVELNFRPELIAPVGPIESLNPADETSPGPSPNGIGVTPGQVAIRSAEVWHQLGITGQGRLIGSCDTGVDGNHPALASRWRGNNGHPWQECWMDNLGTGTTYPNDGYGHGTHTTGTMTGVAPDDTIGVAWGAQWIANNAINQGVGSGFDNDIIASYQWFVDPDGNPGTVDDVPDVIQNSWGVYEGLGYADCFSSWWTVIDNCEAAGTVTCWSAGNEGSGAGTLRSPADRATTLTNCFSVGAVDATSYPWPYPIASFSSRGPTTCAGVPPANQIKPEVSAPGVDVYSSVPGGGYQQSGWSGTSMAGPHAAGIVALMRQADPDLDVETIKQILMQTARDEGAAGEDNTFGHGFVDAYEAVLSVMSGYGQLAGTVWNASVPGLGVGGAEVTLSGTGFRYVSAVDGAYQGYAPAGNYTAHVTAPGFDAQDVPVTVVADVITTQDFQLSDVAGPAITGVSQPVATPDVIGPYGISAHVSDPSGTAGATLAYRVNDGAWQEIAMTAGAGDLYSAAIPGAPANSRIDYYVRAADAIGHQSTAPAGAPGAMYSLYITQAVYATEVENPGDPSWQVGLPGDTATTGRWIRAKPIGTSYSGQQVQAGADHTPAPGVSCYLTGNGAVGGAAGDQDIDNGCTTLVSPVFDLSGAVRGFVRYWRWFGQNGSVADDQLVVDVSSDGGATWVPLERVPGNDNVWRLSAFDLASVIPLTSQVVFRFVACDLTTQNLVEAAVDDFSLETWSAQTDVAGGAGTGGAGNGPRVFSLTQNHPNPFGPATSIQFELPAAGPVRLQVYSVDGRRVASLLNGTLEAGAHVASWDGRDERGEPVSQGVYFYRLEAGERAEMRRMILMR